MQTANCQLIPMKKKLYWFALQFLNNSTRTNHDTLYLLCLWNIHLYLEWDSVLKCIIGYSKLNEYNTVVDVPELCFSFISLWMIHFSKLISLERLSSSSHCSHVTYYNFFPVEIYWKLALYKGILKTKNSPASAGIWPPDSLKYKIGNVLEYLPNSSLPAW